MTNRSIERRPVREIRPLLKMETNMVDSFGPGRKYDLAEATPQSFRVLQSEVVRLSIPCCEQARV